MKTKEKAINYSRLQPHPLGAIFPPLGDEDYEVLCASIKNHGLMEPIILHEGKILDGNNRYTACKKVKVMPTFRNFDPKKDGEDPIQLVIIKNLARRNLTPSQAATLGAELVEKMNEAEKAAEEASANLRTDEKKSKKAKPAKGVKAAKAAKVVGSSSRNVEKAAALKKSDPKAFEEVKAGKKSLHKASKETEVKKTKAQIASEEYEALRVLVKGVYGDDAEIIEKKISAKEFTKLAGLDEAEMERVKPFLLAGWKLAAAMGYKSVNLSLGHTLRMARDHAIAQGGIKDLDLGDGWHLSITKK